MKPMFKMKGLLLIIMVSLMLTLDANASQKFFPNPPVDIHQGFILNELPSGASDSESDTTGSTAINPVLTDTAFRNSILVLAATPRDKTGILGVGWSWLYNVYLFLYVLIGMFIPTTKEYEFLLWPFKIWQWLIPNLKTGGGVHMSTLWSLFKKS